MTLPITEGQIVNRVVKGQKGAQLSGFNRFKIFAIEAQTDRQIGCIGNVDANRLFFHYPFAGNRRKADSIGCCHNGAMPELAHVVCFRPARPWLLLPRKSRVSLLLWSNFSV